MIGDSADPAEALRLESRGKDGPRDAADGLPKSQPHPLVTYELQSGPTGARGTEVTKRDLA